MSQTLYRFYDRAGALLYIGIARHGLQRWQQHQATKLWWDQVAMATVKHYATRPEVVEAERTAIAAEHPRYNIAHQPPVALPAGPREYDTYELLGITCDAYVRHLPRLLESGRPERRPEVVQARAAATVEAVVADLNGPDRSRSVRRLARLCGLWWSENQAEDTPLPRAVVAAIRHERAARAS